MFAHYHYETTEQTYFKFDNFYSIKRKSPPGKEDKV